MPRRPSLAGRVEALLARHWWQPRPTGLSRLLQPPAALLGLVAARRRRAAAPSAPLPVPVLVVGNLIAGGAGKTPTVIALVQSLRAAGRHPGVVSRGHGRVGGAVRQVRADTPVREAGDEPLLIARRTGAPVWVGRDRRAAVQALCRAHPEVDVVLSDDGLQHLALARQAELLVFDERGIGNGLLLPAGPLREPLPRALGPRQRVLYTGARASTALPGVLALRHLGQAWPLAAWHAGQAAAAVPVSALRGRTLLAVAGLAAPEKFFAMLEVLGLRIERLALPDHYDYRRLPWPEGSPEVVTTEKDAIKLDPRRVGATRVWVLPLDLELPPALLDELQTLLAPQAAPVLSTDTAADPP